MSYKTFIILFLWSSCLFGQNQITLQDYEVKQAVLKKKLAVLSDSLQLIESQILKLNMEEKVKNTTGKSINVVLRPKAKLREEASPVANEIMVIDADVEAVAYDYIDDYLKVCIGQDCGFVSTVYIYNNSQIDGFISDKAAIEKANRDRINLAKESASIAQIENEQKKLISKYGKEVYEKVKNGQYWLGMTKELAIVAFGVPNQINESKGAWGTHEQWVYTRIYLYFENGKLTSYQRSW